MRDDLKKAVGFLLLVSGLVIVLAAIVMLRESARSIFILTGFAIQITGLVMAAIAHTKSGGRAV